MRRRTFVAASALVSTTGCLGLGGDGDSTSDREGLDERGTIEVIVDGQSVDLGADRFQAEHADEALAFHLHAGDDHWYMEGHERVTLAEAVDLLPRFDYQRDGWRTVVVDGQAYEERDRGVETAFSVNDALVDPEAYELQDGDAIRTEVTTQGAATIDDGSGPIDAKGELDVVVDGEPVDLSRDRFQAEHGDGALAFHLHEGDDHWYMEGTRRVTVGEGLDLLPRVSYAREDGYHALAIDGTEYDERDAGTELAFYRDGELVDPRHCEIADGDALLVEVATGA